MRLQKIDAEEVVNPQKDEYAAAKKMMMQTNRRSPFQKLNWFVFGLSSYESAPFVSEMIDFKAIVQSELIHEKLLIYAKPANFTEALVSAVKQKLIDIDMLEHKYALGKRILKHIASTLAHSESRQIVMPEA